ncbi:MAG: hypothetical protein ACYS76_08190 [Planctomycetota bacterium]
MNKARQNVIQCVCFFVVALVVLGAHQVFAGPLPGAIFTTLEDGSRVNANIYEAMEDVYLDGGPPQNAPSTAAGLPEGDYYFQVTDPSGKVLLSLDPVKCRRFHVNAYGVIDYVYPATCLDKVAACTRPGPRRWTDSSATPNSLTTRCISTGSCPHGAKPTTTKFAEANHSSHPS